MSKTPPAYQALLDLSKEIAIFQSILSLLHWDQETYMPKGGIQIRSKQIAELSALIHEKKTAPKYKAALEKLISLSTGRVKVKGLSLEKKAALREWRREFLRLDRLPASFVKEFAETTSEAGPIWIMAKETNQFQLFAPFLTKIVELSRKKATLLGFDEHPYDALLAMYEPCMSTSRVAAIFSSLKKELISLLRKIQQGKKVDNRFLRKKVSKEIQMDLATLFLSKFPIVPEYSRLDLSAHPFSTALHPCDSRITSRILENDFMSHLFSTFHEAGHSIYEMGLLPEHFGTPLGEAVSLSIHESQSKWWECLIGRSLPFWKGFYPLVQQKIPSLKKVPLSRFYRAMHKVEPSFIRVEADEVTYSLHVILRFEIEKGLIEGKIQVSDLPKVWNEKMREFFGITPKTDREGCLQDIHWSLGDFGYFPTYALGNLFSAQFFFAFAHAFPDWEKRVKKRDLMFIKEWLNHNIHRFGKMYNAEELVRKVSGKPLSERFFVAYLKKKYQELYF